MKKKGGALNARNKVDFYICQTKGKKPKKPSSRPGSSAHRPSSKSSRSKRTPTPRESSVGNGTSDAASAAETLPHSQRRRSGATGFRLPPVISANGNVGGVSGGRHDEIYTKSTAASLWQQEYLPEIMKKALMEQVRLNQSLLSHWFMVQSAVRKEQRKPETQRSAGPTDRLLPIQM